MNPRLLRTFLTVARWRSFTRAATEEHLAQSSVSDQIQSLESEVGAVLFNRTKFGLQLTPAGEALLSYADEILALGEEARAAIANVAAKSGGTVSIGSLETIASSKLATWMRNFREQQPKIELHLTVATTADLMGRLERSEIDVAFCFHEGPLDERLVKRTVDEEPLVLIGPGGGRNTIEAVELADLSSHSFVVTAPGCTYRRMFDSAFSQAGIARPRLAAEVDSIGTIIKLVAAGAGLALVPQLAVLQERQCGEIAEGAWPGPVQTAALTMVWRRRRVQPPALRKLLAAATDCFEAVRSAGGHLPHEAPTPS